VRFTLPTDLSNSEQATVQTMVNLAAAVRDQPAPRYGDRMLSDRLVLRAYRFQREVGRVDIDVIPSTTGVFLSMQTPSRKLPRRTALMTPLRRDRSSTVGRSSLTQNW
jgi:hypothetical protein